MNPVVRGARRFAGRIVRRIPWLRRRLYSSSDYRIVSEREAREGPASGWLSRLTTQRQEKAYEGLLVELHAGKPRIDFEVAAAAVRAAGIPNPQILEVGCGSGYYVEVFEELLGGPFNFTGLDYAPAMVESASQRYPHRQFRQGDATRLPFGDNAFDIVFNGVSLMHIIDYKAAIAESSRVAAKACIFHSVPVFQRRQTTYLRKYAYGSPVAEIVFNEGELMGTFEANGLKLAQVWQSISYDVGHVTGESSTAKTFLCTVQPKENIQ